MKRSIPNEVLRQVKSRPKLMRKLMIFFAVGATAFVLILGLVIWAAIAGIRYATDVAQNLEVPAQGELLKGDLKALPALTPVGCWDKAQSLMTVAPWLEKPIATNIEQLRVACFEKREEPRPES